MQDTATNDKRQSGDERRPKGSMNGNTWETDRGQAEQIGTVRECRNERDAEDVPDLSPAGVRVHVGRRVHGGGRGRGRRVVVVDDRPVRRRPLVTGE